MIEASVWTLVLWAVHGLLALCFLAAGAAQLIWGAEVLGAAGLVLSMATGVLPWLTPLAAVGLAVVVGHALGAIVAIPVAASVASATRIAALPATSRERRYHRQQRLRRGHREPATDRPGHDHGEVGGREEDEPLGRGPERHGAQASVPRVHRDAPERKRESVQGVRRADDGHRPIGA